jgi:hypothetical protein
MDFPLGAPTTLFGLEAERPPGLFALFRQAGGECALLRGHWGSLDGYGKDRQC